jgi:hypothetical protein
MKARMKSEYGGGKNSDSSVGTATGYGFDDEE